MHNVSHMDVHRSYDLIVFHLFKCFFQLTAARFLYATGPPATLIRHWMYPFRWANVSQGACSQVGNPCARLLESRQGKHYKMRFSCNFW